MANPTMRTGELVDLLMTNLGQNMALERASKLRRYPIVSLDRRFDGKNCYRARTKAGKRVEIPHTVFKAMEEFDKRCRKYFKAKSRLFVD